ncbi:efflux RND transporter periplasmic adaptor subunit [candidate division KSB1 bacterium]|nr:efflux RND transporter periplasmic adaptor subunit [candidate division KSB1 bacterium]MCH7753968.1 efflux RND transporter periplasmic adaptor subunit [candidate division KSB1 bacterium]
MKVTKRQFLYGLSIVGLILLGFLFFNDGSVGDAIGDAPKYKEFEVRRGTFEIIVSATGEVKPIDRIEIKSKASGVVEELPVEEGDIIQKGDLIARLDQKDERAEVEQTQANFGIAKAELKQAEHTYGRRDKLFQRGLISEEELGVIELNLAIAKGKLIQAKTALARATERLAEAIVLAPINGIILQKYVEEGQIIASGVSNVSGGTPIADIADMSSVHIEAGIDEIDIGKIEAGQTALVVAEAYPERRFRGKIVRISPEARIEQNVTLFDVIIEVENRSGLLKSGMNANAEITIVRQEDVLLAPAMALKMPGGRKGKGRRNIRMALLKQENEFVPQRVEIGLSNFKDAVIVSGLNEGDIVGVPMVSRLMDANNRFAERIRSTRGFGASGNSSSSSNQRGRQSN